MPCAMGPLSTKLNPGDTMTETDSLNDKLADCSKSSACEKLNISNCIGTFSTADISNTIDYDEVPTTYYAVFIPMDIIPPSDINDYTSSVFKDKTDALKLVKQYKRARFKCFTSLDHAKQFSATGICNLAASTLNQSTNDGNLSAGMEPMALPVGEKPSPFKGPKSQDLVLLRKAIEKGDYQFVEKTIWENPKYLVSSGDTPSIMHEGGRYNAMHVAAKHNHAKICSLVLNTISNVDFIRRLYGDTSDNLEAAKERCDVLLDLYLNTPDRGCNDTPLHFASKFGSADAVRVLVSYQQCDKTKVNKYGETALEVNCSRYFGSEDRAKLRNKIASLLSEEQYFIPVLRSPDPCLQPTIGELFSVSKPLDLSGDIKSPVMEVHGIAGPMALDAAKVFRKKWKTPPRDPKSLVSPNIRIMLQDLDKGIEKVGRDLAEEKNIGWTEFWPFLNKFANFRTKEGLDVLEQYLQKRFRQAADTTTTHKSLSSKTVTPDGSPNVPSAQIVKSPMSELCDAFRSCTLASGDKNMNKSVSQMNTLSVSIQANPQKTSNGLVQTDETSLGTSPHLYIEKSCQVFAKRIADGLLRYPEANGEPIGWEVEHLNSLVSSFLNDVRFDTVDFSKLHSRLANHLYQKLMPEDKDVLVNAVDLIHNKHWKMDDSSSEEEATPYRDSCRRRSGKRHKKNIDLNVRCIVRNLSNRLTDNDPVDPATELEPLSTEEDCIRMWEMASSCQCVWLPNQSKLRHSFRRGMPRRIDFSPSCKDERSESTTASTNTDVIPNTIDCSAEESAGEESDTDSDYGEFFTPPSSPRLNKSPCSSEDDTGMESPDEGPEVYINGSTPTSIDNAVLEAIGKTELNLFVYPNICRWKHLISLHSTAQRERWPSPKKPTFRTPLRDSRVLIGSPIVSPKIYQKSLYI